MNYNPALWVAIFSFNRAEFLQHCVASVERCMPFAHILIVDDHSTDPQTQAVLAQLRQRHNVIQPSRDNGELQSKHGGLYANMQLALDWLSAIDDSPAGAGQASPDPLNVAIGTNAPAIARGSEIIMCTLQDDMQIVRPVAFEEFLAMQASWRASPQQGFLHPAFLKGSERQRNDLALHQDGHVYINQRRNSSVGAWYSDIFIAPVARLRQHGWQFGARESANEAQARQLFEPMGYLLNPFIAWLPAAPCWRGKRRTWAIRQGERRHGCGFHPFHEMTPQQLRTLCERPPSQLPYAEDYLRLQTDSLTQPWVYHPLQGSRWLKWLNSLELKLIPAGGS